MSRFPRTQIFALPEAMHIVQWLSDLMLVGGVVFGASLFGILTRPVDALAAFWPANALLLGLLVRHPRLVTPWSWGIALIGYLAADLLTGNNVFATVWLTVANLVGVIVGVILFRRLAAEDLRLERPQSVLYLFAICVLAAIAAALVGCGATTVIFQRQNILEAFAFWWSTEFVNYCVILPVILTAPGHFLPVLSLRMAERRITWWQWAPVTALLLSAITGVVVGGPGAIAFPVPALLWCALTYNMFATVCLTLVLSVWHMIAISSGVLHVPGDADMMHATISVRLGIALIALGPITLASINSARNKLLEELDRAANYDALTGALARGAFIRRGTRLLSESHARHTSLVIMMLDIDHFKSVNDQYGHSAGDRVLTGFAHTISQSLRDSDLFGRIGGEEFAIILPRVSQADALAMAERLRGEVERQMIELDGGVALRITVSIGVAFYTGVVATSLDGMLLAADNALYRAKLMGRNRVVEAVS